MREEDEPIDVSASPELLRLAEEVRSTGKPRVLRRDGEALAMIVPLSPKGARGLRKRALSARDIDAFRSAAGTWSDVDVERFLMDVYAARDVPDERPSVEL
jgi:hypothetical protein